MSGVALDSCCARDMTAVIESTDSLKELVDDAARSGTPLRISGRSHWIDAGRPVDATRVASLATHSGVVDYVPGDLTITVRSGTTLGEIEDITRNEAQWLPIDPFGTKDGTIGATIATGSFGPLASSFGRMRDLVLGIEFITGHGKIVRGGGRVVKNVAGFDLVRLITGSWGTLGIVTEATLRLYSLPSATITLALGASDSITALQQRINSILQAPGIPFAVELVSSSLSDKIGIAAKQQLLVRLGGNSQAVAAQRTAMESLGGAREMEPAVWDRLRTIEDSIKDSIDRSPIVVRLSCLSQRVAETWTEAHAILDTISGSCMHATPSLGIIRCILPGGTDMASVERLTHLRSAPTVIFERLPHDAWELLSPSVIADRISQRLKNAFDPLGILNPGILGTVA
jgi:glycolate oxidase FAD binding subunit